MNRLRKVAVLTRLTKQMRSKGSWCGETHLQKATYFLQELLRVPTEFDFILYKHGPFSFDLRDELTAMQADGVLALEQRPMPYGPTLVSTNSALELQAKFPRTLSKYNEAIDFVADKLGTMGVAQLERLATVLWVTKELESANAPGVDTDTRARRVCDLKPHVSIEEARSAAHDLDQMAADAEELAIDPEP